MASVFILGATGYIGGSILVTLKAVYPEYTFKALLRPESASHSDAIKDAGAIPVIGAFEDHDLVANLAAEADIVVNAANGQNLGLKEDLLKGLKRKHDEGRGVGALILLSGSALFWSGRDGKHDPDARVWTDNEEDVKEVMEKVKFDNPIIKADEEGYVNTFFIAPSGVFSAGLGPVPTTQFLFRLLLGVYVPNKRVTLVGEGTNTFAFVHMKDLMSLALIVFKQAVDAKSKHLGSSPYTRFFIASTIDSDFKTLASGIAKVLHERGRVDSATPVSVSFEDAGSLPVAMIMATNTVVKPVRARSLGWSPQHLEFESTVAEDVEAILQSSNVNMITTFDDKSMAVLQSIM